MHEHCTGCKIFHTEPHTEREHVILCTIQYTQVWLQNQCSNIVDGASCNLSMANMIQMTMCL